MKNSDKADSPWPYQSFIWDKIWKFGDSRWLDTLRLAKPIFLIFNQQQNDDTLILYR